jgi:predicted nuclease with TOPRIM domain
MRFSHGMNLLMQQKEFTAREAEQSQIVNERNEQIKNLTARIINLEAKIKISDKENEILRLKCKELEGEVDDRDNTLQGIRSRGNKS